MKMFRLPRVKEKKVFQADPLIGWTTYPLSYAPVFVSRTETDPMSEEKQVFDAGECYGRYCESPGCSDSQPWILWNES